MDKNKRPIEGDPEVDEVQESNERQTPREFAKEMFGEAGIAEPVEGMPSIDWIKENYQTKSAAIRYLVYKGFKVKEISKHLGIKYQHVRNVATNPLKRGPNEDWRPKEERDARPQPMLDTSPRPVKLEDGND